MQTEQMKSRRGRILVGGVIALLLGVGVVWWALAPDELTPEEELAKKFVEAAYIHKDPEGVRPLVDPDWVRPESYTGKGNPTGKLLIGSVQKGIHRKVVIILPEHYGTRAYVEVDVSPKGKGGWIVTGTTYNSGKPTVEEVQQQPKYQRWGLEKWKTADAQ